VNGATGGSAGGLLFPAWAGFGATAPAAIPPSAGCRAAGPPRARGGALVIAGVGLLGWIYALAPPKPLDYALFWIALGLCLAGVLVVGFHPAARAGHHLAALAAFGAVTWLPHYLRSPARPIFSDELYHYQELRLIEALGHTRLPVTLYPIPGEFPGLALAALAVAGGTGLPLEAAARLLTIVAHMAIPGLAYLAGRAIGLGRRGGLVAALIYIANTSYYFFHAVFSYETLGILLALAIWALLVRGPAGLPRRDLPLVGALLVGLAATHHLSSYLLAALLVAIWAARGAVRGRAWRVSASLTSPPRDATGVAAALSVVAPALWLLFFTGRTVPYLSTSITARLAGIATSLRGMLAQESEARPLFSGSPLPPVERLIDLAYVPVLLLLGTAGMWLVLRRLGVRGTPATSLALAPCGPLGWIATVPAILTPAAELAYRSWPFLFLGLAAYAAAAIVSGVERLARSPRLAPLAWPAVGAVLAVLLFGGISVGDNQGGRFPPSAPTKAGGPEAITGDLVGAAAWLKARSGPAHLVVGDGTTQAVFATIGDQRATAWGNWIPFLERSPTQVSRWLAATGTEYLLVDRRITRLPPRYGYYFGEAEIYFAGAHPDEDSGAAGRPLDPALLAKFDAVPDLARIYDNGDIQIHERVDPLGRGGGR